LITINPLGLHPLIGEGTKIVVVVVVVRGSGGGNSVVVLVVVGEGQVIGPEITQSALGSNAAASLEVKITVEL
jgi:hypothetical protein